MSKNSRPPVLNDLLIPVVRYVAPLVLTITALLATYLSVSLIFNPSGVPGDRSGDLTDLATVLWVAVVVIIIVPSIGTRKPKGEDPPIPSDGNTPEEGGG